MFNLGAFNLSLFCLVVAGNDVGGGGGVGVGVGAGLGLL